MATYDRQRHKNVLDFINIYGPEPLMEDARTKPYFKGWFWEDVTNDGVPEFMYPGALYKCEKGKYQVFLQYTHDVWGGLSTFEDINDWNQNGISELFLHILTFNHGDRMYQIYEWDRIHFRKLLVDDILIHPDGVIKYKDLDNDRVYEVIAIAGTYDWFAPVGIELRNEFTYYKWDGKFYTEYDREYDDPKYRFQAIQDADYYAKTGEYNRALTLYKEAISSGELEWWSVERKEYMINKHFEFGLTLPEQDWMEYHWLASYARFRMIVVYLLQNHPSPAQSVYAETLNYATPDLPGYHYYKLGAEFWDEYQLSSDINKSCAKAIGYATEHPELLAPLGSDYHGYQSKIYKPEDVCFVK
ncbi:MAG: hypothetical protein H7Y59_18545 [Anaerolineales bacterium]|nr:hypothetical protein [Anaerolineales bacterium]